MQPPLVGNSDGLSPRRLRGILAVACTAFAMLVIDFSIVGIALPRIERELGFRDAPDAQWVMIAYTVVFAGMLMLAGRLVDTFGRKRLFVPA